jgi:DNA-binding IclR family transcriptional regulator
LELKRQGLSLAEIAQRTDLHVDSVRRILRKLARQLAVRPAPPRTASRAAACGPSE